MSPVEIVFVVLGVIILVVSCFVTGSKESEVEVTSEIPEAFLEFQKQEIKKYIERVLEEKSEEVVVRTDDYLSKVSNEKIMAVNDFTSQILEKIDFNHKEVVFLYDMLNQKEDEIKKTVKEFDSEKKQMQEIMENAILLKKQINLPENKESTITMNSSDRSENRIHTEKQAIRMIESVKVLENRLNTKEKETDLMASKQKEKILQLYKQGKSVLEISKALKIGQGEVKLIIGLYTT